MAANKITRDEALQILFDVILKETRHEFYKENKELAEEYEAWSLGEDINEKLHRFTSTESEAAFDSRKELTVNICRSIVSGCMNIFNRVPRSEAVNISWLVKNEKEFKAVLDNFGRYGFEQYINNRLPKLIELDPNSFIVYEFAGTDGKQLAQPYPYEVYSENAIMFEYKNADLLYLIDMQELPIPEGIDTSKKCLHKFTIYCAEGSATFIEQPFDIGKANLLTADGAVYFEHEIVINIKDITYKVEMPLPYSLEQTPATQVGYLTNDSTDGKTFVNQYHQAIPFLEKILKTNSELDITMGRHAHMQKIQYVRKCTNQGCTQDQDGIYRVDGNKCTSCAGSGMIDVTRGGLEFIYLPLPDDPGDIVSLDNIIKYIQIPIETPNLQNEYIDKMIEMFKRSMFNTDIFSKDQLVDTATAKLLETENLYDSLYLYAVNYGMVFEEGLIIIGDIIDREVKVIIKVGKDFKLLTKSDLLLLLKSAQDAGANDEVIALINKELVRAWGGDEIQFELQRKLIPFAGKTKEQIMLILSGMKQNDALRLKYLLGVDIIKDLIQETPAFINFTFEKQRAAFEEKILAFVEMYKPEEQPTYLQTIPEE